MPCRRLTVKDIMRTMRAKTRRTLTREERQLALIAAQQTVAFACTPSKLPLKKGSLQGMRPSRRF